jgi:lysophospholipase L1-like esterase
MNKTIFKILICSAVPLLGPAQAFAQTNSSVPATARIMWEVENRFRLFKDKDHFRGLADVYAALPAEDRRDRPAFALEEAMQLAAARQALPGAFGEKTAVSRYGWTQLLTRRTCFENGNRGHWKCTTSADDEFMEPRQFDMLARLDAVPPALATATCRWSAGDIRADFPCAGTARLRKMPFGSPITLTVESGGKIIARLENIKAENRTIAGFGDSFASGEGNPDKPVTLVDALPSDYQQSSPTGGRGGLFFGPYQQYPRRPNANAENLDGAHAAIWLNSQCHRSLYSNQLRAALILALEQPHVAVTFTGYACTGAEVDEGVLGYWKARDDVGPTAYDASPQLMRYLRDFCKETRGYHQYTPPSGGFVWQRDLKPCPAWRGPRPDAVLLSIGGNDVGFARVIANEILAAGNYSWSRELIYGLWLKAVQPMSFADARRAVGVEIPAGTRKLSDAFRKHLGVPASSIIQVGYPQMTKTERGACGASRLGMDVHRALGIVDPASGTQGVSFVKLLNGSIASSVAQLGSNAWQVLTEHSDEFAGHSICDGGAPAGGPDSAMSGGMAFPTAQFTNSGVRWAHFRPSEWKNYRPRNRWFVTPNDSFLAGHYMRVGRGGEWSTVSAQDPTQPILAATLGGSFHPNAQGHARIADAIIPVLRKQLDLRPPD